MSDPLFQKIAAVWTRTCTGSLSALSSSLILYMMWSDREFKLKDKPNNRILFCMSIVDLVQSIAYALHTLPLPASSGLYHAIGNSYTCAIQRFIFQLGLAVPAYNASLCIWYLMVIKYNMSHTDFARKVEPYCHAYSIFVPLSLACIASAVDNFQQRNTVCWVDGGPRFSRLFRIFCAVQVLLAFVVILYCLATVYHAIYQQEQQMMQYSLSPSGLQWTSSSNVGGLTYIKKKFAAQITLFSFAFIITFLFPIINIFVPRKAFGALQSLFLPLQGMLYFVMHLILV